MLTKVFRNYLTLALRKFRREKLYSLINLAGLSIAIASCLILGLYLRSELTFDQHNELHERVYRITTEFSSDRQTEAFATSSSSLAPMMTEEFVEFENYARLFHIPSILIRYEDKAFHWDSAYIVDPSIFDLFTHEIIYGDRENILMDDTRIAVSESFARRYFGNENPIGKIIGTDDNPSMSIALVFADLPINSHHRYDVLFSAQDKARPVLAIPEDLNERRQRLGGAWAHNYVLVSENFDPENFESMADAFIERHFNPLFQQRGRSVRYSLEPLADIHLHSNEPYDEPGGNLAYVYALGAVALFILLVACINYINLATARSLRQAKEVGMRKILGADKNTLVTQFISESIALALLSTLVAVVLVELILTLTPINELFAGQLNFSLMDDPKVLLWLCLFSVGVGVMTGLYPAFYLSSWAPLSALVSSTSGGSSNAGLRKALVLMQFTVSVAVVACTLLMSNQMRYFSEASLGFEKENRIAVRMIGRDLLRKAEHIQNELETHPNVLGAAVSSSLMGQGIGINGFDVEGADGIESEFAAKTFQIDYDFATTMGLNIVDGRNFSRDFPTDKQQYLVNQTFAERIGWENPIGKKIEDGQVIGVVQNFHFESLHSIIDPILIRFLDDLDQLDARRAILIQRYMTVNIAGEDIQETLNYLEDRFAEFDPKHPFEFQFLDASLEQLYQSEQNLMRLIGIFSGLCIFIACLGLFGLASFTTEQRNKEIGIRKTLGASAGQIIFLLSKSMLSLVLIGAIAGCVLAYFAISFWLSNFAYRADMTLLPYVIAAIAALLVAYLTVALQSYKTAQADPVDALRYE